LRGTSEARLAAAVWLAGAFASRAATIHSVERRSDLVRRATLKVFAKRLPPSPVAAVRRFPMTYFCIPRSTATPS
jgi:hypothetical protein